MKILVVTSEVTFVPNNYRDFLESLLRDLAPELAAREINIEVAILKNNSLPILAKSIALQLMGAWTIGGYLFKNSLSARFNDKKTIVGLLKKPLKYFSNPNSEEFLEYVRSEKFDLIINARTRYIYKKKILKLPRLGCLNIHHGLLPDYRGTMCDLWALYDERPTGFSIHVMEQKIDDGAIVRRIQTSKASEMKNYAELIFKSSKIEGSITADLIRELKINQKIPIELENNTTNASYSKNPNFGAIRKMLKKGIIL